MGNALVRALIHEVKVKFNGDAKDQQQAKKLLKLKKDLASAVAKKDTEITARGLSSLALALDREVKDLEGRVKSLEARLKAKDNVIAATLVYPRSGASQLVLARAADLASNEKPWPATSKNSFYDRVLFKEEIQGEARLVVAISDRDPRSGLVRFFRGVASALFATLTGGAVGSLSGVIAAATAGELRSFIGSEIRGSNKKERETLIARSKNVDLEIASDGTVQVRNANTSTIVFDQAQGLLTLALEAPGDLDTGKAIKNTKAIKKGSPNGSIKLQLDAELS